jgi:DNA invertase Pin-like site-specific DNA recombinase
MRAAIYIRLSQDRNWTMLGVDRQREDCDALVQARGWTPAGVYVDNDVSATRGKPRPAYRDLMASVERGEVDRIVCYMNSRVWRNRRERAEAFELLQRHQIGLVPVKGPELDFSSAIGRMVAGIIGEVDTAEVEIKAERSRREVKQRAEQGRPHGGPRMFGVAADGRALVDGEADEIRRWYDLLLAGASITSLAKLSGRHHSSVIKILRNPRNAGLRMLDGVTYGAPNPAIVPEATWRAAVGILADEHRRVSPSNAYKHLGAGLYRCADCDLPVRTHYTPYSAQPPHVRAYWCRRIGAGCGRSWQAQRIDDYIIEIVAQWIDKNRARLPVGDRGDEVARLTREAAGIRQRRAQLGAEFAADDDADLLEFREAARGLRDRLFEIESRLAAAGSSGALAALAVAPDPVKAWRSMRDAPRQRAVVASLMTVDLLRPARGRSPKQWDPRSVVKEGWLR